MDYYYPCKKCGKGYLYDFSRADKECQHCGARVTYHSPTCDCRHTRDWGRCPDCMRSLTAIPPPWPIWTRIKAFFKKLYAKIRS